MDFVVSPCDSQHTDSNRAWESRLDDLRLSLPVMAKSKSSSNRVVNDRSGATAVELDRHFLRAAPGPKSARVPIGFGRGLEHSLRRSSKKFLRSAKNFRSGDFF